MLLHHLAAPLHLASCDAPPPRALPPLRRRSDLGGILRWLGLRGNGVELGVQAGVFSAALLAGWGQCDTYVQVDLWRKQHNYVDEANKKGRGAWSRYRSSARKAGQDAVEKGHARKVVQCANYTTSCVQQFADESFDFVCEWPRLQPRIACGADCSSHLTSAQLGP